MGALAVPLILAGAGGQAAGQIFAGQTAYEEGKAQAKIAEYNAQVQDREAQAIEQRTQIQQRREAQAAERQMGSLRAKLGASGAVTTAGTPLLLQTTQASESELQNLMIGFEGATEASRARGVASQYRMEGQMAKARGKSARTAGYLGAGTTLLTGFGNAYNKG